MVFKVKIVLCLLVSFVLCNNLFAQIAKDAGMWNTLTIQHAFSKKINVVIDQEFRLRENYQRINLFYTNVGVDYKINKNLKISPTIRFIQKKLLNGNYSFRNRFMLDVTAKKKMFNKWTISERVRYQIEVADYNTSEKGKLPEQFLRFKTDLEYQINKKIEPYYSIEFRYQIRDPKGQGPKYDNHFHRMRNVLGAQYKHNNRHSFNLYYLFQTEFNINTPESIYVLGIGYTITI